MTLLAQYYVPGLRVEDRAIDVPLDWTGKQPGDAFDGETIRLFYRVVTAPEHVNDDLPLLVFLQGGPGGSGPRPLDPASDGWIAEAIKHFRVILPDQRGTGRSSRVDGTVMRRIGDPAAQAAYLKHFLADSIVKDFEHLRRTVFCGRQWVTLGQSYGGFLTLTYLSFFPEGVTASFTCGGIPHVPADATEVYEHTFPRMARKTAQFYERYPQDAERAAAVADILANGDVTLPNGDPLTVERFQMLGSDFGMKPSFERVHWILDQAFLDGDGSASKDSPLSEEFLASVMNATASRPLYWPLQEFIYADGELERPIHWAAQRVRDSRPEFATGARPLLFTGEAMFPWMFEQEAALRPFAAAMDLLMDDTSWGRIYDVDQLARNEVPLQAAVYFDDMYVDSGMQLDTLSRVGASHYWTTNEFEHDGLHGSVVFGRLYDEALNRGDLESLF
ncbi:proline iminopeptidase [Bifidobacterium sp. DSM 109958]|uniref:Proline iminopeptidase n=1 Tax=Bifidobacterium moraviense TaxID=2675323 RepID=A0A7Y0HY82_9BIFI|nr:alpha/beta fold hydrolase [Bifidobacterium sp. DSM 109958]NMM99483.1 proline iminopeptidase [Bifidobacterium sp. DSM 109958]